MVPVAAVATFAQLRNGTDVGAWLFKANPGVWDVLGALRAGTPITSWPMVSSYRVDLVGVGQPCVLWVTGGRHSPTTGVWAVGAIASDPYEVVQDEAVRPCVDVDLCPLSEPVRLIELLEDPRFSTAEIIRAPRVVSPVALAPPEVDAIAELLGSETASVTDSGRSLAFPWRRSTG